MPERSKFKTTVGGQAVIEGVMMRGNDKTCLAVRAPDGEIVAEGSSTQVFLDARGELQLLAPEFYRKWKERWDVK